MFTRHLAENSRKPALIGARVMQAMRAKRETIMRKSIAIIIAVTFAAGSAQAAGYLKLGDIARRRRLAIPTTTNGSMSSVLVGVSPSLA